MIQIGMIQVGKKRFASVVCRLALPVFMVVLVTACASGTGLHVNEVGSTDSALSGELVYRQRIAMSPDAVIRLRLVDTNQHSVLAQQVIRPQGQQVPIPFKVEYASTDFVAANQHKLLVTIHDGHGNLRWASDALVDSDSAEDLRIRLMQATVDRDALIGTQWHLLRIEQADGAIVWARDNKPSTIVFDGQGRFGGKAACNSYFGSYELAQDGTLQTGHAGATLMACPSPNVAHEFLQALAGVDSYAIAGSQLRLISDDAVLVLTRNAGN